MATILHEVIAFVAIPPGGIAVLPYHLNINGHPILPDLVFSDNGSFSVLGFTATDVTVMNNDVDDPGSLNLWLFVLHTMDRVFGATQIKNLVPQPFLVSGGTGGGGGGGVTVRDEGVDIGGNPHQILNFLGGGVTATDAGGSVADVTIPSAAVQLGLQAFRYTVTGLEPDLSDFFIPLPAARPTDTYKVTGTLAGTSTIVGIDCPDLVAGDRTLANFRLIATAPMTAGDQIDFVVVD